MRKMLTRILIIFCKGISFVSSYLGFGNGGTWPGEIALMLSSSILGNLVYEINKGIILVAGTNGKTTTSLMISRILQSDGNRVIANTSGANLLNGIVSALIKNAHWNGKINADYCVFEVDENSLPLVISNFQLPITNNDKKLVLVLLNLFRDQLDRYGEVDVIAQKWQKALSELSKNSKVILNSDDPQIAFFGKKLKCEINYFGLTDTKYFLHNKEHATDSIFCLHCGHRLSYNGIYYSHIGDWYCTSCGEKRPTPQVTDWNVSLPGIYNRYNTLAAVSVGKSIGIRNDLIQKSLEKFSPAFGRQEEFYCEGKKVKIFLSKNPVGFNESLKTVLGLGARQLLLILNDRIPDGRDVSWIWDVDFEMIPDDVSIIVSGDRTYDLAVRMKYALKNQKSKVKSQKYILQVKSEINHNKQLFVEPELKSALRIGLEKTPKNETLFILPTYSAMLEVRKILTGRKIL